MATDLESKPSFSQRRKWGIGLDMFVRTVVVLAVVVMVNYLGGRYFQRFYLSSQTRIQLSPRTVSVLKGLTNKVEVTLYYDKEDSLFTTVSALLNEYRSANPRFHVTTVDYIRDPGAAAKIVSNYHLGGFTNKNLVIFDCERRSKVVYGDALAQYTLERVPNPTEREFRRKPTAFLGEMMFTAVLLEVSSLRPLHACFLQGHQEHALDNSDEVMGYMTFASVLKQNYVQTHPLSLLGTNTVPAECNLLVIAGPRDPIPVGEVEKIEEYLRQGGRLLALLNPTARGHSTGLERILAGWGVDVGAGEVRDKDQSVSGADVVVSAFSEHPIVNPLYNSGLYLVSPYPVGRIDVRNPAADAPRVEVLFASSEHSRLASDPTGQQRRFPLAVVVERGAVKGVLTERGSTRIVAVGDSIFFGNRYIDWYANRDFANYVVNWLLERTQLLQGPGPRSVTEFRLTMTHSQLQVVQWILLGALPGAVLLFGGLVWLRRRK